MENIILTNNKDLRLVSVKVGVLSTLRFELPLVSASATHVEVIVTSGSVHSAYTATFIADTKRWQCDIAASQFPAVGKQSYEVAYVLDGKQFWDGKGWIEIEDATTSGIEPQPRPEPYRYVVVSVNGYGADAQGAVRIPKTFITTDSPATTEGYMEGDIYFNRETGAMWTLCNVQGTLTWVFNYSNYYTKAETDEQIDRVAAYYITYDVQGNSFPTHAALVNASTYYSGGVARTLTRNDYAVVLADETHGGATWRYIYAEADGATTGQWEAQYPIKTNDYEALSNKPKINNVELSGNKTLGDLDIQSQIGATGILKGNGTGSIIPAVPGTDYATPDQLPYALNTATVTPGSSVWTANYSQIYDSYGELVDVSSPEWGTYPTSDGEKTGWFWPNPDMVYELLSEDESATSLEAYWTGNNGEETITYTIDFTKTTSPATVTNVKDRATNAIAISGDATLTPPTQVSSKSRDFCLSVTNSGSSNATITVTRADLFDPAMNAVTLVARPSAITIWRLTEMVNGAGTLVPATFIVTGANQLSSSDVIDPANATASGKAADALAVKTSLGNKQAKITASGILQGDGSGGVTAATVDSTPTANSTNLVTSGGVKAALDNIDVKPTRIYDDSSMPTTALDDKGQLYKSSTETGGHWVADYYSRNDHVVKTLYYYNSGNFYPHEWKSTDNKVLYRTSSTNMVYTDGGINLTIPNFNPLTSTEQIVVTGGSSEKPYTFTFYPQATQIDLAPSDFMARLSDIAPQFSTSTAYAVGTFVGHDGGFYKCTATHSAGAWNASHFTAATKAEAQAYLAGIVASISQKANAADLRYSFNAATVGTGTTPTVANVLDRARNKATLGSTVTAASVTLPAATAGRMRDFYITLIIEATNAPTLTFIDPVTNMTADMEFGKDSLADIDTGENLVLFTECDQTVTNGTVTGAKWMVSVKHEEAI